MSDIARMVRIRKKELESDLLLANVEALAVGGETDLFNRIDCYNSFEGEDEPDATQTTNRCSPCGQPLSAVAIRIIKSVESKFSFNKDASL